MNLTPSATTATRLATSQGSAAHNAGRALAHGIGAQEGETLGLTHQRIVVGIAIAMIAETVEAQGVTAGIGGTIGAMTVVAVVVMIAVVTALIDVMTVVGTINGAMETDVPITGVHKAEARALPPMPTAAEALDVANLATK